MFVKKNGTALISTVIILSLMSLLGTLFFKMMRSNRELEQLSCIHGDRYDLKEDEEKVLYDFMKKLNKIVKERNNDNIKNTGRDQNKDDENLKETHNNIEYTTNYSPEDLFQNDFKEFIGEHSIYNNKEKNKLILSYSKGYNFFRNREIEYKIKGKNIILVPTYKFQDALNK